MTSKSRGHCDNIKVFNQGKSNQIREKSGNLIAKNVWPPYQCPWFSEVLRLLVSAPIRLPHFPNILTQAMGKFQHQNLPTLALHAWELSSNQIKSFCKTLQILSQNQEEHLQSVMQNGLYTPIGVIERRLIQSRLLALLLS